MPSRNSKKTNAPVSPPTSHSGLVRTEPPVSRGRKRTQSTVDTTAEPATKKPAITADEEAADNSAKQGKGDGGKGRVLATTPSESSESEDNNLEAEHGSGTENVSQNSNEEDEDKDGSDNVDVDNDDDDEGEEGEEVEEGNEDNVAVVEAMDIDSVLASEPIPTKEELKGGILRG
ncbi:hypothetical protein BDQ17DRAFT_1331935 [Cyathus striatus]|nr:hypothetical protein BDQ17DRAFT_1331935 [Cyathus striatus]